MIINIVLIFNLVLYRFILMLETDELTDELTDKNLKLIRP